MSYRASGQPSNPGVALELTVSCVNWITQVTFMGFLWASAQMAYSKEPTLIGVWLIDP